MSGPWEKFQGATPASSTPPGPWTKFQQQGVDKYHSAAQKALADERTRGGGGYLPSAVNDLSRKALQGATMGWADELQAGVNALATGIGNPMPFGERYKYEKALLDERNAAATQNTGKLGTAAEIAGGVATGGGMARAGLSAIRPGQGLLARTLGSGLEGAGYGAVAGAGGAEDGHRGDAAIHGAAWGGGLGAAAPAVVAVVRAAASPVVSNLMSWADPSGAIRARVGEAISRSGVAPDELTQRVQAARDAGQHDYTLADALNETGDAGTQALRAYGRAPGAGRSGMVDFLDNRQVDQGTRISGYANDAFGYGGTAQDFEESMRRQRSNADAIGYPAAREAAGPVDLAETRGVIEGMRNPSGVPGEMPVGQSAARPPVERAAQLVQGNQSSQAGDFNAVLDAKQQIDDMIGEAARSGRNYEASQLNAIKQSMDDALAAATPGREYEAARNAHRRFSEGIDAIDTGRSAFGRSTLPADAVTSFERLPPHARQGAQVGFKDALQTSLPSNPNANGANALRSPFMQQKIDAFAVGPEEAGLFNRRIGRENTMSQTRNAAMGGSPTADILAAQADGGVDPRLGRAAADAASGNFLGAAKNAVSGLGNGLNGNTEQVRDGVLNALFNNRLGVPEAQSPLPAIVQQVAGLVRGGVGMAPRAAVDDLPAFVRQAAAGAQQRANLGAGLARGVNSGGVNTWQQNGAAPIPVELPTIHVRGQ